MKWSKKKTAVAGVIGVCAIASLFSGGKEVETINISIPDYQEEYDINTDIPVEIAVEPEDADTNNLKYETDSYHIDFSESGINTGNSEGTFEAYVSSGDIQSNTLSITVVDMTRRAEEKAAQEAAEKAAQEAASNSSNANSSAISNTPSAPSGGSGLVWIPKSGSKYHSNSSCSNMKNPNQVTLEQAQAWGYEPCKKCY